MGPARATRRSKPKKPSTNPPVTPSPLRQETVPEGVTASGKAANSSTKRPSLFSQPLGSSPPLFGQQPQGYRPLIFGPGSNTSLFGQQPLGPRPSLFDQQPQGFRPPLFGQQPQGSRSLLFGQQVLGSTSPLFPGRSFFNDPETTFPYPVPPLHLQSHPGSSPSVVNRGPDSVAQSHLPHLHSPPGSSPPLSNSTPNVLLAHRRLQEAQSIPASSPLSSSPPGPSTSSLVSSSRSPTLVNFTPGPPLLPPYPFSADRESSSSEEHTASSSFPQTGSPCLRLGNLFGDMDQSLPSAAGETGPDSDTSRGVEPPSSGPADASASDRGLDIFSGLRLSAFEPDLHPEGLQTETHRSASTLTVNAEASSSTSSTTNDTTTPAEAAKNRTIVEKDAIELAARLYANIKASDVLKHLDEHFPHDVPLRLRPAARDVDIWGEYSLTPLDAEYAQLRTLFDRNHGLADRARILELLRAAVMHIREEFNKVRENGPVRLTSTVVPFSPFHTALGQNELDVLNRILAMEQSELLTLRPEQRNAAITVKHVGGPAINEFIRLDKMMHQDQSQDDAPLNEAEVHLMASKLAQHAKETLKMSETQLQILKQRQNIQELFRNQLVMAKNCITTTRKHLAGRGQKAQQRAPVLGRTFTPPTVGPNEAHPDKVAELKRLKFHIFLEMSKYMPCDCIMETVVVDDEVYIPSPYTVAKCLKGFEPKPNLLALVKVRLEQILKAFNAKAEK
ncbi:hypothetical protein BU16DRAFT_541200 [Lophium mytilinum]|uniref:Uncharacterized protein n=1 Tax=Lophium mytilinum TaxID=390894 RepID=A0A6A6QN27_9PEZI|nr:hypothetical protein BU16DRAFT_541200 [Lophium mytilinum]